MASATSAKSPLFPVQQGHLARLQDGLDFVNTLHLSPLHDHLDSPASALEWLAGHNLMHREARDNLLEQLRRSPEKAPRVLGRVHRARAALRGVLEATAARRPSDPSDLAELNRTLRAYYVYELVPAPDGVTLEHRHHGDPVEGAIARLVESVARELIQGHPERLRVCQNEECRWVFADASRTGQRKWCSMSSCGNRAKVARFRARQRAMS